MKGDKTIRAALGNLQRMKMLVGRGVEVNDLNDKTVMLQRQPATWK